MSLVGKTIIMASSDEAASPNLCTCRQCGSVVVPQKVAAVRICGHCGATFGTIGTNAGRFPKQGTDIAQVNGKPFVYPNA